MCEILTQLELFLFLLHLGPVVPERCSHHLPLLDVGRLRVAQKVVGFVHIGS